MNRRKFFGLTAATVAALGLPEIVLPERKIFLPPRAGWYDGLRMREVSQYLIDYDCIGMRHDAVGYNPRTGEYCQFHVDSQLEPRLYLDTVANPEELRAIARSVIEREFKHKGLLPVAPLQIGSPWPLRLPRGVEHALYV